MDEELEEIELVKALFNKDNAEKLGVMSELPPSMIPIASQLMAYDEAYRMLNGRGSKTSFLQNLFSNFVSQDRMGRMEVVNQINVGPTLQGRIDFASVEINVNMDRVEEENYDDYDDYEEED